MKVCISFEIEQDDENTGYIYHNISNFRTKYMKMECINRNGFREYNEFRKYISDVCK